MHLPLLVSRCVGDSDPAVATDADAAKAAAAADEAPDVVATDDRRQPLFSDEDRLMVMLSGL